MVAEAVQGAARTKLPEGWTKSTLGKACVRASKVNPKDEPNRKITYLDIGGIDNQALKIVETKTYKGADAPSRARQLVKEGDVLFSTVRTYLKKIAQVPAQYDGEVASTGFTVLRCDEALDPKFLFYYVTQDAFIKPLSKIQRGTSYPAVRDSDVFSQPILIPPLPEQRRIVAKIEACFARLDAGVAALKKAKAQLQRYRQSVLAAAVTGELTQAWREAQKAEGRKQETGEELLERILQQRRVQWSGKRKYKEPVMPAVEGLPEIPDSWTWSSPAQLSAPEDYSLGIGPFGSNLKVSDYTDSGVPLVFVRHIRANDYTLAPKFVSMDKASELKAHSVDPGDLLITKMGEPPGDAALYPESCPHAIITADCIKFRLTNLNGSKSFFVDAINSKLVARQIAPITRGVAQKKISLDRFRDIALPLPPLAEQNQIVAEVEARTTAIDHLEAELDRQITRSNRLRQSTLANAFEGEL